VEQKLEVPVSGIGPLLVLKLSAFDDRQQPKHAYDVMLGVTRCVEGPAAAIAAFLAEANTSNRGFARARAALRNHFLEASQSGMALAGPHHAAPMGLKTVLFGRWYYKHAAPTELAA